MASVLPLLFQGAGTDDPYVHCPAAVGFGCHYPVGVLPGAKEEPQRYSARSYVLDGTRRALLEGLPSARCGSMPDGSVDGAAPDSLGLVGIPC